eukprot:7389381-Prymnesium_polylepis.3
MRGIICANGAVFLFVGVILCLMMCRKLPTAGVFSTNQIDKLRNAFHNSRANTTFQDFLAFKNADQIPGSPPLPRAVDGCALHSAPSNVYKGIISSSYSYSYSGADSYSDKGDASNSYQRTDRPVLTMGLHPILTAVAHQHCPMRLTSAVRRSPTLVRPCLPFARTYFDTQCIIANDTGETL